MYLRGFVTGMFVAAMGFLFYEHAVHLIQWHAYGMHRIVPSSDSIEAGPFKVVVEPSTDWVTIYKMIFTVLTTYLGIKLINKFIR